MLPSAAEMAGRVKNLYAHMTGYDTGKSMLG
jgi:hypothetical protein